MNIGLIGLDTSHSEIFTRLINDNEDPFHVKGGKITHVIPTFSKDMAISSERFPTYFEIVKTKYGVQPIEDVEELMKLVDAVIIGTVDGRNHLEWFKKVVRYGKPIFIDKPIVMSSVEMEELMRLSIQYGTPIMSSSSLRFSESVMNITDKEQLRSGYFYGPVPMQEKMPGYLWYGIHLIEMIVTIFGTDIKQIKLKSNEDYEYINMIFNNKAEVIVRGENVWHDRFGAVLHSSENVHTLKLWQERKPYYAGLIEHVMAFFKSRITPVPLVETAEIIKIVERINSLKKV
ncbi:Gfo/Idh/MocA family oxidoreductase [Sporosarcina limicola]|uniref:Dehydrogenase n=1 Tax=Sporosarcina limicola TaxID=34101 RepID=A0A927MKA4_9BACL|nr:Gfo/Idh/MocA family oxidoreductase [Sporosarcina limicola]MBE1554707.1 putative dehydrogenase [Sporosarcina limicola]